MDESTFQREMMKAKTFQELGERPDYWAGYQRGLRRRYHGENFGTEDEHDLWMDAINSDEEQRRARGQGYRDGFVPDYCTQNEGNCPVCSLVNYGRDCQNNPIET